MTIQTPKPIHVIAVAGPTAAGKSAVALALAERLGGEIVCADSMQIYRGLDIGTAKPTPEERARVPHHMCDVADPGERYSVARYLAEAAEAVRDIARRGRVPILCGGTGQYISGFTRGLRFSGPPGDESLRAAIAAELEQKGPRALLDEIAAADPEYAATMHERDTKRMVRAVELLRTAGYTIPRQNELSKPKTKEFLINLAIINCDDRKMLYNRIEQRAGRMLARGLLEEARAVYQNRERFLTAAQAIGYKEFFPYFEDAAALEECVCRLKQATRNYAKRQLTWFRAETEAAWYSADHDPPGWIAEKIEKNIEERKGATR